MEPAREEGMEPIGEERRENNGFVQRPEFDQVTQQIAALTQAIQNLMGQQAQQAQFQQIAQEQQAQRVQALQGAAPRVDGQDHMRIKLLRPKPYAGATHSGAVENFLFDCRQYFDGMEVHGPHKRILFAVSLLEGVAKSWWRFQIDQIEKGHATPIQTWGEFELRLRSRFCLINAVQGARDKLDSLKQVASVRAYISAFQNLIMQIPEVSEGESLHRFKQGLQFRIKKEVALREPQSLEEAMRLAEKYDALLYSVQGKKASPRPFLAQDTSRAWRNPVLPTDMPIPMEIDMVQRQSLIQEDREQLRKVGGCFYCRKTGHVISACPVREKSSDVRHPTNQIITQEDHVEESENQEPQ